MTKDVELYYDNVKSYLCDVNIGWNIGFEKLSFWSPGATCGSGTDCGYCSPNWESIVTYK